jgi:hypothetical protein
MNGADTDDDDDDCGLSFIQVQSAIRTISSSSSSSRTGACLDHDKTETTSKSTHCLPDHRFQSESLFPHDGSASSYILSPFSNAPQGPEFSNHTSEVQRILHQRPLHQRRLHQRRVHQNLLSQSLPHQSLLHQCLLNQRLLHQHAGSSASACRSGGACSVCEAGALAPLTCDHTAARIKNTINE